MPPRVRRIGIAVHVVVSVGWLGAVAAFFALAVAGIAIREPQTAEAAYLGMEIIASWVIVPLALASLLTGILQALGTPWGLWRHYWIVVKLVVTVVATLVLLLHMRPIETLAQAARDSVVTEPRFLALRVQIVANAAAALLALGGNAALGILKPKGLTRRGRREREAESSGR